VEQRIQRAEAFTLPTQMGNAFVSVSEASATARQSDSQHVQIQAEKKLGEIEAPKGARYIRGCSGFAGFPIGSVHRSDVEHFSSIMEHELGAELWASWGTEQFTSNYFIANATASELIPFSAYPYWELGMDLETAKLIHFIGDDRFTSSKYAETARSAISTL
jgi:hypothetical protein